MLKCGNAPLPHRHARSDRRLRVPTRNTVSHSRRSLRACLCGRVAAPSTVKGNTGGRNHCAVDLFDRNAMTSSSFFPETGKANVVVKVVHSGSLKHGWVEYSK